MILTGKEIIKQVELGEIIIKPFDESRVGPNGYDVTLNEVLLKPVGIFDMRTPSVMEKVIIPPEGLIIYPGEFYLGCTNEVAGSDSFVPVYEGRSSVGRLGIVTEQGAGFGDIGFAAQWTLEISTVWPVRIYPNVRVAQIAFHAVVGDSSINYKDTGKYSSQVGPQPSMMWKDFLK